MIANALPAENLRLWMTTHFSKLIPILLFPRWIVFASALHAHEITPRLMTGDAVRITWNRVKREKMPPSIPHQKEGMS